MVPAMALPTNIAGNANLNLIFNKAAMRLPLHTPVPGKGKATNINNPHTPYFSILPLLLRDLSVSLCTIFSNVFVFFK